jgi:hypothetical protein
MLPVATGVSGQRTPRHLSLATCHCSFVFITLQIPFPATPLFSHPYKTPGVSPLCLRVVACPDRVGLANPMFSAVCRLLKSLGSLFATPVVCFQ